MVKKAKTYEDWLDEFLEEKAGLGLSKTSLKGYEFSVNKYLKYVGDKFIDRTTYYNFLNSLDCSPTSKKHYARDVRCFLYWCQREKYIPEFKVSLPKGQEPTPKIVDEEEVSALLFKQKDTFAEDRMYIIICLILSTGLRCRSIVNITVNDIDFIHRTITVRELKNKHFTVLPISEYFSTLCKKYTRNYNLCKWLFPADNGEQLTVSGLQSCYKRYARARNVRYGLHALRHYYATQAVKHGVSVFALQKMLGHSSVSVTQKYVNLVDKDLRNEMERMDLLK